MFIHLRKGEGQFDTVRAEELRIGDRFVFDGTPIKVVSATNHKDGMTVLMERTTLKIFYMIKAVTFPSEMYISIARR